MFMAGANEGGLLIISCADKILELGNNWYKQSAEWEQFPSRVDCLRAKLELWERETGNRGLSSHATLTHSLQAARSCLEEEQKKLANRKASCGPSNCWRQVGRTVFPAQVGLSIQRAIDAFESIQQTLESLQKGHESLDRFLRRSPLPECITHDNRYVPLEESETKIFQALDSVDGPVVVLLHGGPGTGKSCVARNTVVHYSHRAVGRFEHVFLLNCGPEATLEETHFELIGRLGCQPFANQEDDQRTRSIQIQKQVTSLLAERKMLLILDDVSNGELVRRIVEICGCGVRCLVTSRLGSLCRSLYRSKYLSVEIQEIGKESARQILASHSGLPNHQIPSFLQGIADKMIDATHFNPLALASLASVIDPKRSEELSEWEDACTNFFRALKSEVPAAVFNGRYPRSLWASMGLAISTLREDARNLLLLAHACAGPSVPEEVIQIIYTSTKLQGDSATFSTVRSDLESRQLIKITSFSSGNGLRKQRTWQVNTLQKTYIDEEMKEVRDSIFSSLTFAAGTPVAHCTTVGKDGHHRSQQLEDAVPTALCALYLHQHLAGQAAEKIGYPLEVFNKKKRRAIESLTRLLALSVSDRWTATARSCATQVFLRYVCNSALEDLSIAELLRNPAGAIVMYFIPIG